MTLIIDDLIKEVAKTSMEELELTEEDIDICSIAVDVVTTGGSPLSSLPNICRFMGQLY